MTPQCYSAYLVLSLYQLQCLLAEIKRKSSLMFVQACQQYSQLVSLIIVQHCMVWQNLLVYKLCCCPQAAKQDLVDQSWKGFFLSGNYVSGRVTCLTTL